MLAIALAFVASGSQSAAPAIVKELTSIEQQLADTYRSGRCDAWGAWLAEEWSVIHITGAIVTKADALATCRQLPAPIERLTSEVISVRSYGDAAVVTGRTTATAGGSAPTTVTLHFTDVFVRRDGRWLVVASHATRLAP